MSKIIALYVYAPTEFTTDTKIEKIDGSVLAPDQAHRITLPAGIYRYPETASVTPVNQTKNPTSTTNIHTKGDPPDPPQLALDQLGSSVQNIGSFLNGAGEKINRI